MDEWNLKALNIKTQAKQRRIEEEQAANEAKYLLVHGLEKPEINWAVIFWIIVFVIGVGAVLLVVNYYQQTSTLLTRPDNGISSSMTQAPADGQLAPVTVTPLVSVQTLDVIPVVVNGVLQTPVWLNPVTSGMPYYDQFPDPVKTTCQDASGFNLSFPAEAKDVYLVKIVTPSGTIVMIIPGVVQVHPCTLGDQFFLYVRY